MAETITSRKILLIVLIPIMMMFYLYPVTMMLRYCRDLRCDSERGIATSEYGQEYPASGPALGKQALPLRSTANFMDMRYQRPRRALASVDSLMTSLMAILVNSKEANLEVRLRKRGGRRRRGPVPNQRPRPGSAACFSNDAIVLSLTDVRFRYNCQRIYLAMEQLMDQYPEYFPENAFLQVMKGRRRKY
ncbi:hypothetical protein DdX_14570 [Ditylenchus destructor]|uniref:Uncharacterized protein n=1 Tax=Ditylenchus destructor TaxID=166010 RepID=A0AAD4MRX0_9BILA|nr:hypothetical protein DdX_14570 [Ditylenchus destructor]